MKPTKSLTLMTCLLSCLALAAVDAGAIGPRYISYQGTLTDDTGVPVPDGDYSIQFRLYDAPTGGTTVWYETQTVTVTQGVFDVTLGKANAIKSSRFSVPLWLAVAISGQAWMVPRVELTASPYTLMAATVEDGAIGPTKLADNTVVRSINGITGDIDILAGPNVSISEDGTEFTISAIGGSGGDDGDWTISGAHLYHNTTGTVSLGTSSPSPLFSGQAGLQVSAGLWPSITLDRISPFQRWVIMNEGSSGDLWFGYTSNPSSPPGPTLTITNEGRVGVGRSGAGAMLDVQAGNGDVVSTNGDLRLDNGTGEHQFRVGVYGNNAGSLAGETNLYAKSTTGTARINLGLDDQKVVSVDNDALDFYGYGNQVQARLKGSTTGSPEGELHLFGPESLARVILDGRNGNGASLFMRQINGVMGARLDSYYAGGGRLTLYNTSGTQTVIVDGDYNGGVGRILTPELEITGGSDLSEQFDVQGDASGDGSAPVPGSVVCIDPSSPGGLCVSTRAYDRRVAGIISGAGGVRPGMLMGQKNSVADGEYPVALTGRVYVQADANMGAIEPGDLLTTSNTPGHAMKVTDHDKANGAVLGKAMTSLNAGQGLVLVLVSLQ